MLLVISLSRNLPTNFFEEAENISMTDLGIDAVMLLISFGLGTLLATFFPGRVSSQDIARKSVEEIEIKRNHFRMGRAASVAAIAWIIHIELELIERLLPNMIPAHFVQVEGKMATFWLLLWIAIFLIHVLEFAIRWLVHRRGGRVSDLLVGIKRIVLMIAAIVLIGQVVLDWHPAALFASTAVFSMVFGLAIKDTLGDLLAGISLNLTRSVLPSQWIKLPSPRFPDSMLSGEVLSTNWRETRVRTSAGHIFIIPNSQIAGSVIHNMSWPDDTRRHAMNFFVTNYAHPDLVTEALLESVEGNDQILSEPKKPYVLLTAYQEVSTRYTLYFWTHTYHKAASLEGGIRRKVWDAFEKRDIRLPMVNEVWVHKQNPFDTDKERLQS
uniref:Small-conductance mechanosensitive channel n=1 Tax=Candidatus Kentrum sp. FW TaxID=2126338 RepID=A0A450TKI6_9GAMM|nr:MAG: Small-conductance mechanosensitive channel [Candidatus Kentron sp. FW]